MSAFRSFGISRHLKSIYKSGKLDREATIAFFATSAADGKTYQVEYFNLDAIDCRE
jgi:DNA ligase (NAD+)